MTDDKIALRAMLETGSDAIFLYEIIGFSAQRLTQTTFPSQSLTQKSL